MLYHNSMTNIKSHVNITNYKYNNMYPNLFRRLEGGLSSLEKSR